MSSLITNGNCILTSLPDPAGVLATFKKRFQGKFSEELPYMTEWVVQNTLLKYTKISPELNAYYIYDPEQTMYIKLSKNLFEKRVYEVFNALAKKLTHRQVMSVTRQLALLIYLHPSEVNREREYLCFQNGILNLITGKLIPHTPDVFLTSKLRFCYNTEAAKPANWHAFIKSFTQNDLNRISLIRAWLKLLVHNVTDSQTILYIVAQNKGAKQVIANLAILLGGEADFLLSTIKTVTSDVVDVVKRQTKVAKKTVYITQTEIFSGDINILKRIPAGDLLEGTTTPRQVRGNFYSDGILLIASDDLMASTSELLTARLRILYAANKPDKPKSLLARNENTCKGLLIAELPGIFNWVYTLDLAKAREIILNETVDDELKRSNPVKRK